MNSYLTAEASSVPGAAPREMEMEPGAKGDNLRGERKGRASVWEEP